MSCKHSSPMTCEICVEAKKMLEIEDMVAEMRLERSQNIFNQLDELNKEDESSAIDKLKEEIKFLKYKYEEPDWMRASHVHCKHCQSEVEYKFSLASNNKCSRRGVRRVGICNKCDKLVIQYEYDDFKYVDI